MTMDEIPPDMLRRMHAARIKADLGKIDFSPWEYLPAADDREILHQQKSEYAGDEHIEAEISVEFWERDGHFSIVSKADLAEMRIQIYGGDADLLAKFILKNRKRK